MSKTDKDQTQSRVTITQIAEMSGYSISTVSRVINNSDLVDEKTRAHVKAIMEKTNYMPNKLAQGLVKQASKTIALIIPDVSNHFFADIIHGVEDNITKNGYSMYLCNSNFDHDRESRFLEDMVERCADGAIIISAFLQNVPLIHKLNSTSMRIVGIQTQINGIDCVNTTDYDGMRQVTEHLLELGHRKIGFICIDLRGCKFRYQAYLDALQSYGITPGNDYIKENTKNIYNDNPGYFMAKELLDLPNPPTAIQALNDYLALGVYKAIKERGLKIPDDISVTGYDDLQLSCLLDPPLTTVRQPAYEMGEAGAEILLKNITSGAANSSRREVLFNTQLIVRNSTKAIK